MENIIILGLIVLDEKYYSTTHDFANKISVLKRNNSSNLSLGGPPAFMGSVANALSEIYNFPKPMIYSHFQPSYRHLITNLPFYDNINWFIKPLEKSPRFQLIYHPKFRERDLKLIYPPTKFQLSDFQWDINTIDSIIIGSVFQEFNYSDIFEFLRNKTPFLAFDAQGCFRQFKKGSDTIEFKPWWNDTIIRKIDCLKLSEIEIEYIKGFTTLTETMQMILSTGPEIVIVTRGSKGAVIGLRKNDGKHKIYSFPAFNDTKVVDETGAGDAFLYSFVVHFRKFNDPLKATAFATSVASLLIERKGIDGNFNRKTIQRRMDNIMYEMKYVL